MFFSASFLLTACTSVPLQQTPTLHPSKTAKGKKNVKKENMPPTFIQLIKNPERLRVILYSDVCFRSNGRLTIECSNQLKNAMKTIKQYGDGLVQVVAYTDDIYDPQTAEKVSQRQADFVAAFLWSKGIASQRLRPIGFGIHDPIASNRSVKASAANRRVEITLVK